MKNVILSLTVICAKVVVVVTVFVVCFDNVSKTQLMMLNYVINLDLLRIYGAISVVTWFYSSLCLYRNVGFGLASLSGRIGGIIAPLLFILVRTNSLIGDITFLVVAIN